MPATDHNTPTNTESTITTPSTRQSRAKTFKPKPEAAESHFEPALREYNTDLIQRFLDTVFHADLTEEGEVLTWMVNKHRTPSLPITEDALFDALGKTKQGKALYYGTASCRRDHTGKLWNRQALFERLHVIVLDDIGTKGDGVPEELKPTYIIESSKGNFQYGYVLKEPIDNLDAAKALVQIMYGAGIADAGGKMPNKLVRLPEGINGKKGDKCHFVSNLVTLDGPLWDPQDILDILDSGATWAEIAADGAEALKKRNRLKAGTTPWAPYRPTFASMTGIIDPVVEWLGENDQIVSENGDWVNVKCPWGDEHSSGDGTAGYKPLGTGEDPTQRGFHCFHDSCVGYHTRDYLSFIANMGGPTAGVQDKAADMVSTYAYDTINDIAWKIKDTTEPKQISMSGLKNTHPRSTLVATQDGKLKPVSEYQQWLTSESRVTVMGPTFDPSNPSRLVERDGDLFVNQFSPPTWGTGPYDEVHVSRFKQFVDFLIPIEEEREYFLDWFAAKAQDMGFRGAAIVMIAQKQGVGRSTLADMIGTLLGEVNVRNEPFEKLVGEGAFNEWVEAPFVVSDETLNTGGMNSYKTYEKLKELIDPRPRLVTVNPKYGKQRRSMVHSTFLFLSNHSNALSISEDDRRFYVVSNPHTPAAPSFYRDINAWLDEVGEDHKPVWAQHVYRWLLERKPNMEMLLAPPKATAGKAAMIEETRADLDVVARELFAKWPCEYMSYQQFTSAVESVADRLDLYDINNYKAQLKRIFNAATYPLDPKAMMKIGTKNIRVRVLINRANEDSTPKGEELSGDDKAFIRGALVEENIKAALSAMGEGLDVAGL